MTRRAIAAVAVWAVAIGAAALWLTRGLVVTTDLSAFLPTAATPAQKLLVGQLREGIASRLILIAIDGSPPEVLAKTSRALAAALAQDARFPVVANGELARFADEQALLRRWRYLLSPGVRADRVTAEGLRAARDDPMRQLASPLAPLGETCTRIWLEPRVPGQRICCGTEGPWA